MKLSLVTIKALNYKYNEVRTNYNKYRGNFKINILPKLDYIYVLENINNLIISEQMFNMLHSLGYIEHDKIDGSIIKVKLNKKYFNDLKNKQEI